MEMKSIFKHLTLKNIAILAMPITLLLSVQTLQANNSKTWSGSVCQAKYGDQESRFYRYTAGIKNVSSRRSTISCAITRDELSNSIGTRSAYVHISAPSTTGRSTCYLRERRYGNIGASVETKVASKVNGWIYLDTNTSVRHGVRILECQLQPGAQLSQITISEY